MALLGGAAAQAAAQAADRDSQIFLEADRQADLPAKRGASEGVNYELTLRLLRASSKCQYANDTRPPNPDT